VRGRGVGALGSGERGVAGSNSYQVRSHQFWGNASCLVDVWLLRLPQPLKVLPHVSKNFKSWTL
jgi:hypothetical protein